MKKLIIVAIIATFAANIFSQKLEVGFLAGYQHTNAWAFVGGEADKIDFKPNSNAGFNVGGIMLWNIRKGFGLDLQLLYSMRSYGFDMVYQQKPNEKVIFKRQTYLLELPIHMHWRFSVNNDVKIYPLLGASFNVNLHGKDYAYLDDANLKPIDKVTKNEDLFDKSNGRMYRFEISPEIGLLVKYKNWGFRPVYSVGVTNLTKPKYGWSFPLPEKQSKYLFNRELKLSFIYTFKIK